MNLAVSKVEVVSIIGLMSNLDLVVETCGKSQAFQPDNALSFYPNHKNLKEFSSVSEKNPFDSLLQVLKNIAKLIDLELKTVDILDFNVDVDDINEFVRYSQENFSGLSDKREEILKDIGFFEKSLVEISHFVDKNMNFDEIYDCKYLKSRFGCLPQESFLKIQDSFANPFILFFPFSTDQNYYWGVYFCTVENSQDIDDIFSSFGFKELKVLGNHATPEERVKEANKKIKELKKELSKVESEILKFVSINKNRFLKFYTKLLQFKSCFDIKRYVYNYKDSFILVGWVLKKEAKKLKKNLQSINSVEVSIENVKMASGHDPPVKLDNKSVFKPFELFTNMYGIPNYDAIDPTPLLAITYTLIFGMMFGDLGQGLVLAIAGFLIWKKKKLEIGKILIPCGLSATFFGIVYGSFFGFEHALDFFYKKVLGMHEKPIEIMEVNTTNKLLIFSICIGSVLLFTSMIFNIFSCIKRNHIADAVFSPNGVFGVIFYSSLISFVSIYFFKNINLFSPFYVFVFLIIPLVCILLQKPLSILFFKKGDLKDIKWGGYLVEGFLELLFETILGYVSNTMSFLRIGIYILVHAGMMSVVLALAEMSNNFYWGAIIFGNIVVMGLEGLLVGIQVLRLEFYEMFNRFFNDQGRNFEPVTIKDG
ncbi:MAG: ATPase [Oscillospiraceae bacterium]|jgi:V/A-type H+-transporting ATPase subunit I|nr:ATPase [Oscillospiraceae bacterium]